MMGTWSTLHAGLLQSTTTRSFYRNLRSLCGQAPILTGFTDCGAILEGQHAKNGNRIKRNAILRSLVEAAQKNGPEADAAVIVLLLALWPGLDAVHRRLRRHFRGAPEDLGSEILGRATERIRTMDLASVNRIAATTVRNVERDVRRELGRLWVEQAVTDRLDDIPELPAEDRRGCDPLDRLAAVNALAALGSDAPLVLAVVVEGQTQREAAAELGITHAAARKRYRRALARARQETQIAMSHSGAAPGICREGNRRGRAAR